MNKEQNAYEQLTKGIKTYVGKEVSNARFDKTYNGLVKSKNLTQNLYSVYINGVIYDNIKTMGGECEINEVVTVKAPQNNMNNMYIEKYSGGGGEIPIATRETLGGVIIGRGLSVNEDGLIEVMIKQGNFRFNCKGYVGGKFGVGVFA